MYQRFRLLVGIGMSANTNVNIRHSVGLRCVEAYASRYNLYLISNEDLGAKMGSLVIDAGPSSVKQDILLASPLVHINESGMIIAKISNMYSIGPHELIIIHDDLDLHLGMIKIKKLGGAGGHNGVKSIISSLGTDQFTRIRIGIGRPPASISTRDYVLQEFSPDEIQALELIKGKTCDMIDDLLQC